MNGPLNPSHKPEECWNAPVWIYVPIARISWNKVSIGGAELENLSFNNGKVANISARERFQFNLGDLWIHVMKIVSKASADSSQRFNELLRNKARFLHARGKSFLGLVRDLGHAIPVTDKFDNPLNDRLC